MAFVKCKGTALQQEISSTYTAVGQIISIDLPDVESETYEADTLDNSGAGIPYKHTGRTEGGSCGFEIFYDPALASHLDLTPLLDDPQSENWKIVFADSGTSEWTFAGAGFSMGGTVALNDGLKASCSIKLDGIPSYPAGGSAG